MYALACVIQLACKVHVIHSNLAQAEAAIVTVYVWHLLVHERGPAKQLLFHQGLINRLVQDVADGALAQVLGLTVAVCKVIGVEQLTGLQVKHVQLAAHK